MDDNLNMQEAVEETTTSAEAVASTSDTEAIQHETAGASTETTSDDQLLDGKFKTVEDREHSYRELERKFHEQAGQLSELRRRAESSPATKSVETSEPKWKQLESERNKWAQQLRRGDLDEQARWEADNQVRLYDREIAYERAKHDMSAETTRTTAQKRLEQDSTTILSKYEQDLNNQQSPLYVAASDRFNQLVEAGYPMDINTKALAVAYAATVTNTNVTKAVQQNRTAMLKTLNTQVKQAVIAGAGGPATVKAGGISAKDIEQMSDAEFAKYERGLAGV